MTEKSSSICRLSNFPLTSSSLMNISDFRQHSNQTKKKTQQASKYSSTLAKTTSICSYKNTIRKKDLFTSNHCGKVKQNKAKNRLQRKGKKTSEGRNSKENSFRKECTENKKKKLIREGKNRKTRGSSMDDLRLNSNQMKMMPVFTGNWKPPHPPSKQGSLENTFDRVLKVFNDYHLQFQSLKLERDSYKTKYYMVAQQLKLLRKSMKKKVHS